MPAVGFCAGRLSRLLQSLSSPACSGCLAMHRQTCCHVSYVLWCLPTEKRLSCLDADASQDGLLEGPVSLENCEALLPGLLLPREHNLPSPWSALITVLVKKVWLEHHPAKAMLKHLSSRLVQRLLRSKTQSIDASSFCAHVLCIHVCDSFTGLVAPVLHLSKYLWVSQLWPA